MVKKKQFYVNYVFDYINDHGENLTFYEDDTKLREYRNSENVSYEELRDYLYKTYQIDIDDMDCTYLDCLWLKHLIHKMTSKGVKSINK